MSKISELKAQATDNVLGVDILNAEKFAWLIITTCSKIMADVGDYEAAAEIEYFFEEKA